VFSDFQKVEERRREQHLKESVTPNTAEGDGEDVEESDGRVTEQGVEQLA
jgi:hypothetical protein